VVSVVGVDSEVDVLDEAVDDSVLDDAGVDDVEADDAVFDELDEVDDDEDDWVCDVVVGAVLLDSRTLESLLDSDTQAESDSSVIRPKPANIIFFI
jgi:hypothetical protein